MVPDVGGHVATYGVPVLFWLRSSTAYVPGGSVSVTRGESAAPHVGPNRVGSSGNWVVQLGHAAMSTVPVEGPL